MTLALAALCALALFRILATTRLPRVAAEAPGLIIAIGGAAAILYRTVDGAPVPTEWTAALAEAGLAALVFVSAAQIRVSAFLNRCPAAFRLTVGGAPLFLIVCALAAFILVPQLSAPSALLLGATLMLNGAAFDRRAVTEAPAPAAIKTAVRFESAAIIAFGAPIAMLIAGFATTPGPDQVAAEPLLHASVATLAGFVIGGVAGIIASRRAKFDLDRPAADLALIAAIVAFLAASLVGANAVIAAGAVGLVWGEETSAPEAARLRLRRLVEEFVPPAAYLLFGCALAPRLFEADLLSVIFAVAAVTAMRVGPRLAMLQSSDLPKESQVFLAWFGGAPGAASALFLLSLLDDPMIRDHEAFLTVAAIAILAGVVAARVSARPLANAFLRQTAVAKRRRMYAPG